jgi:hypothetical protein
MTMGVLVCLALIGLYSEANGQFVNGNKLYENYLEIKKETMTRPFVAGIFQGYVDAVADCFNGLAFDLPAGVTGGQLCDICGKYLEDHPELRQNSASELCVAAFKKAFPKKNEAPGAGSRRSW